MAHYLCELSNRYRKTRWVAPRAKSLSRLKYIDIFIRNAETNIADDMENAPQLVIDTNILVAALRNRDGPSFALMQAIRVGRVRMHCSPALFLEYEDVLKRPDHLAVCGLSGRDIDAIRYELAALLAPVSTHYQWRPQLRDPADEMVLEAAVNAQAHAIVTYNLRDFSPARLFGIPVLNPEQVFRQFRLPRTRSTPS